MYGFKKYGERLMLNPMAQTQAHFVLSEGFINLSAKKQAKMYLAAQKIILSNPCSYKDAEVMFAVYSDEPHGNKVAKLLDKAGVDRYDDAEKGIGIKELNENDKERIAHWFHFDIPTLGENPHKHESRVKSLMKKLLSIGGWGDYNFIIPSMENADLTVGGLFEADEKRLDTANVWIDLNGICIAEFKVKETSSKNLFKGMHDLVVYKPKLLKQIVTKVLKREYLTQEEAK